MVYFGAASKGCERCRKRKVKCDEKRPQCLKCIKIGAACPGYRDLNDVVFRDESQRIIRNIRRQSGNQTGHVVSMPPQINVGDRNPPRLEKSSRTGLYDFAHDLRSERQHSGRETPFSDVHPRPGVELIHSSLKPRKFNAQEGVQASGKAVLAPPGGSPSPAGTLAMLPSLSQSMEELGANFFFTKYTFDMPPFYKGYDTWLSQTYFGGNSILTAIIEAVGMAGLANTTSSMSTMTRAHHRYQQSLARVNEALNDPVEGKTDEAFMAVILLAFFETVSFRDWDRYNNWLGHIKAATALLELRGKAQFLRQRGAQLFIQVRSQILLACVQQRLSVPPAVVQATYYFETGSLRETLKSKYAASPASISEMSLRIANLRAAAKNNHKSMDEICKAARAVDTDLIMWADVAPKQWNYVTEEGSGSGDCFRGKKHVYDMPWCVEVWNNWRILRIAATQLILENTSISHGGEEHTSLKVIRDLSADICTSVSAFSDYNRVLSLIRPLYIVATEPRSDRDAREYAVRHLRQLGLEMGVRQPVMLANKIQEYMEEEEAKGGVSSMDCDTFLLSGPY